MDRDPKKTQATDTGRNDEPEKGGCTVYLGIVLLAGALFNVPAILKTPETTADKMMLVIVLVMAAGGAILLLAGRKK